MQLARHQFETEREPLVQRLRQREVELAERLHQVGEATHRLNLERAEWEQTQRRMQETSRTSDTAEHQRVRAETEQLQKARHELLEAQRTLDVRQRTVEAQQRQWVRVKRSAEDALVSRAREMSAQRRNLEAQSRAILQARQELERTQGRLTEGLSRQEQHVLEQTQQLQARQQELAEGLKQRDEQRRALDQQQHEMAQTVSKREQDLAARLEQLHTLQQQLEQERAAMMHQQEQLAVDRQQLLQERQQWDERRQTMAASQAPQPLDPPSSEALTLLANEFNAPLSSIDALIATLLEGDHGELPSSIQDLLQGIVATNGRLRRLVSDALEATRIEHGTSPLTLQPVALDEILAQAEAEIRTSLGAKHLTLSHQGSDHVTVLADPTLAKRILGALLHNAVQFTDEGSITVTTTTQRERVLVTVADTGIGMAPGRWDQLFAKPAVGTLMDVRSLSLYLIRRLARAMGGDVMLASEDSSQENAFAVAFSLDQHPSRPTDARVSPLNHGARE